MKQSEWSQFGERLAQGSGIEELMEDLGRALAEKDENTCMLGGGQPARIEAMSRVWQKGFEDILAQSGGVDDLVGIYDPPQGQKKFIKNLVNLLRGEFGWDLNEENVAITSGGQNAFFLLLNALAGQDTSGRRKKIMLPVVPEYMGYADQSVGAPLFEPVPPKIELLGEHRFKYRVDFDALKINEETAALCFSRPTNPSGNVLGDEEVLRLSDLAKEHGIPLIIDNAYGAPFPNIFFREITPFWQEHVVLTLSLSKLGLPGVRTGIVIASPEIIKALRSMVAITGLANGNVGQRLLNPLLESGRILKLSQQVVQPFYAKKSQQAMQWVDDYFTPSIPYRVHLSEGALFLWFHFEGLPISSHELYERLKRRGVLIVSGDYFFFGMEKYWQHARECIRVTFSMEEKVVERGIQIIAEELDLVYGEQE